MPITKLKINNLLTDDTKLTFLVGAGCSRDPPSCLPMGHAMMDAIIDYTCAESEIKQVKELGQLRFEALVEIIRDNLDKELKIIDFYGLCDKPNIQHFFLAEMIKKGHFVITTNFDFLIEFALQQSGVPDDDIILVITKEDFTQFQDPNEQFNKGKKPIYKIHGSTKNIIKNKDTRDSLIATIRAFGSNKEGENIFQLEWFKQPLFLNITNDRSLVVMGYSGSDDFDIIPTLKVLKNLRNVIWINHSENVPIGEETIFEIDTKTSQLLETLDNNLRNVTQILIEIQRMNNADHVYRVDVNTTMMVKELLGNKLELNFDNFSMTPTDWFKENFEAPKKVMKFYIPYKIYFDFGIYKEATRCLKEIFRIAEKNGDLFWKATYFNNLGMIYRIKGDYQEALGLYRKALEINEHLGNLLKKIESVINIGEIYRLMGNYSEALKHYEVALRISDELGDLSGKAIALNNIAAVQNARGDYSRALNRYEEALKIAEEMGDLSKKAIRLNNIGLIYKAKGDYLNAVKRYEEALKIDTNLGNLRGKANRLNNIAEIFKIDKSYTKALILYEEALEIDEQLGDLKGKATRLNNIGEIFSKQKIYPEALKNFKKALEIFEQIGDSEGKVTCLNNIAVIYGFQGYFNQALKILKETLQILNELGLNNSPTAIDLKKNIEYLVEKLN